MDDLSPVESDSSIDHAQYFEALTAEVYSLKDRIRNFIKDSHWLTDGEWKESVLRSILRRHLPITIGVGRGFIVGPRERSSQIDILIYRRTHPVLYQDGDLVFVAPDAVMGIIEVKTTLETPEVDLDKVVKNFEVLEHSRRAGQSVELPFPFCGLFYYGGPANCARRILTELDEAAMRNNSQIVHLLNVGKSLFIQHSDGISEGVHNAVTPRRVDNRWRAYGVINQGPGYFINAVICRLCPSNFPELWFPLSKGGPQPIDDQPITQRT